jgi:hypothetical protein
LKNGNPVADINAGLLAVAGITAAYVHKLKTGRGQIVETSLMEAALQQTYWYAAIQFATGASPGPSGSAHLLTAPYQAFRASDGWLNIGGANQANWERIADVLGHPEWRDDPRFATNTARLANLPALVSLMNDVLAMRPKAEWVDGSMPPASPSDLSIRSARPLPIRRRWPAAWSSISSMRKPGRPRRSAARSIFPRRRRRSPAPRRSSASTRAKCCASTATRTMRSTRTRRLASLRRRLDPLTPTA